MYGHEVSWKSMEMEGREGSVYQDMAGVDAVGGLQLPSIA